MLIEFRLKNYKSFKDEAVLSLVASNDKTNYENLLSCPDDKSLRILNSAIIYGANASGKSSLFEAFEFAREFIQVSAKNKPNDAIQVRPFLLDEKSKSEPSKFEFIFIQQGVRYQYGFSATRKAVYEEWLITYPKGRPRKLFERKLVKEDKKKKDKFDSTYEFKFSTFLKGEKDKLVELTHPKALFLSVGATFNNPQLIKAFKWFEDKTLYVGSGDFVEPEVFKFLAKNADLTSNIKKLVKFADLGIEDYSFTETDISKTELPENAPEPMKKLLEAIQSIVDDEKTSSLINTKMYRARMAHRAGDKLIPLPWNDESDGTRRLFGMSAPIFDAINGGKVLFIDEIDRSLHPLLVKELVMLFQNKKFNPKNAQLIFNTHDTSLLGTGAFRRDQIWFLEKDQNANSHLYSLLEFSPRKDEALEKGYLQGRYGAVPFLGDYPFGGN